MFVDPARDTIINQNTCATVDMRGERRCRAAPASYASSISKKRASKDVGPDFDATTKFPKQRSVKERRRIVLGVAFENAYAFYRCIRRGVDTRETSGGRESGTFLKRTGYHRNLTHEVGLCYLVFEQTTVLYISRYSLRKPTSSPLITAALIVSNIRVIFFPQSRRRLCYQNRVINQRINGF